MRVGDRLAPLRERDFGRVFWASAISTVGDFIAPVAVAFAVLSVTDSPGALGLVLAARTLALVVFVLVGGVWADRISRQRLMIAADIARMVSQAAFAAALVLDYAPIWLLLLLQAVNGAGAAFFQPASTGLVPQIVAPVHLQNANALLSLTRSVASIAGPATAGLMIVLVGPGGAIAVDAATFGASALLLTGVALPERSLEAVTSFRQGLADGWREVRRHRWLWGMLLVFAAFQLLVLAPWLVLGPVLFERDLGGAGPWSVVMTCWGVGAVFGTAVSLRVHPRRPLVACSVAACAMSFPPLLLGLSVPVAAIAAAAAVAGAALVFSEVLWETAVQSNVPDESLSRVASYDWLGSVALQPVGLALVGVVASAAGPHKVLTVGAIGMAAIFLCAALSPALQAVRSVSATPVAESSS